MKHYFELLRHNRDLRLLYAGTLVSLGGDWFLTVALFDLVLELSHSATLVSLMLVCQTLPIFIATPFASSLVDRTDRRKLMIVTNLIAAGAALLPLLSRTPQLLAFAYLGVIVIAGCSAYFTPCSQAALPNLVASEDLPRASVLMGSTWGTMLAVGAALGGAVTVTLGRNVSFLIDSLSFVLSALLLGGIRASFSEERGPQHEHPRFFESMRETFRYTATHPRALALLLSKGGYGMGAGVLAMLSVFGKEIFRAGAFGIGLLYAARGVGALLGPFVIRAAGGSDEHRYRLLTLCGVVFGIGYMALAFSPSLAFGALAIGVGHLGGGASWMTSTYGLQREVPDWIRGRVFSADFGLFTLTMSLSSIGAGVAADHFGAVAATTALSVISIVWALGWGAATWRLWGRG